MVIKFKTAKNIEQTEIENYIAMYSVNKTEIFDLSKKEIVATFNIKYVGRTTQDITKRAAQHSQKNLDSFLVVYDKLTYEQARGLEQMLINNNGGVENLMNKIGGIWDKNPNKGAYPRDLMSTIKSLKNGVLSLKE